MPVRTRLLRDGVLVGPVGVMNGECLPDQSFGQGVFDFHCGIQRLAQVCAGDVDFGLLRLYLEFCNELIVPRLISGDIDIDVLSALEQKDTAAGQGKGQEQ